MSDATNPVERRRWNDARWTAIWPKRERFTDSVTPRLIDALALVPGERVLDIGCGGGKSTIEAARRVGPDGAVTGADLSFQLVELGQSRVREAGIGNVAFHVGDMQHDNVPGAPFDVAMSQLGVMFFDEPVTAFTNVARHLRAGGRMAFACWQGPEHNPWFFALAVAPFLTPPPPPAPGKAPTGPFALGDPERTTGILRDSGFSDIRRTPIDFTVDLPEDSLVDDHQLEYMGVAETDMPAARAAIAKHLDTFRIAPDVCRFPLALQLFEARRA